MARVLLLLKALLKGTPLLLAAACGAATPAATPAPAGQRLTVNPPGIAPVVPAYSVAVMTGDLVFLSGMIGTVPGTQDVIGGGVAAQTRQALQNIGAALAAAGSALADVVECTVFLRDMGDYAAMNAVYREFFPRDPPARATVAVVALPLPAALVEIKCSARTGRR